METKLFIILVNGIDIGDNPEDRPLRKTSFSERFPYAKVETLDILGGRDYSSFDKECIRDGARDITIELNRYQASSLPIIFIGHNIGASVVKQILLLASEHKEKEWISLNTIALFFVEHPIIPSQPVWGPFLLKLLGADGFESANISRLSNLLPDAIKNVDNDFCRISDNYNITSINLPGLGNGLTGRIPPNQFHENYLTFFLGSLEQNISSQLGSRGNDLVSEGIFDDIDRISRAKHTRLSTEYQTFEKYFSRSDMSMHQLRSDRIDTKSMLWITAHDAYKDWLKHTGPDLMCITGPLDSEVTMISASILHALRVSNNTPEAEPATFVSFSFRRHDSRSCTERSLLVSILRQLLALKIDLFSRVKQMCKFLSTQASVSCSQLWSLLRHILTIEGQPRIFLFIDSLSQCQEWNSSNGLLVRKLASLNTSNPSFMALKILLTGSQELRNQLGQVTSNSVSYINLAAEAAWEDAIRQMATQGVLRLVEMRPVWRGFEKDIVDKMCNGKYTYSDVTLHQKLLENSNIRSTRAALLDQLMVPIQSTDQIFEMTLSRLSEIDLGRQALNWIHHARRPLRVSELSLVLALEPERQNIKSFESIVDAIPRDISQDLHEIFGSIIKIVDNEVLLVHHAFREYFESRSGLFISEFHSTIVERCIQYISLIADYPTHDGAYTKPEEEAARIFFDYASLNWSEHYKMVPCPTAELEKMVREFLCGKGSSWSWAIRCKSAGWEDIRSWIGEQPLPLAVQHGLSSIVKALLNTEGAFSSTTIHMAVEVAAINGNTALLRVLLPHTTPRTLRPVLCLAAQHGNMGIIEEFWDQCSEAAIGPGEQGQDSPLLSAARNGQTRAVKALLEKNIDAASRDSSGNTAVHLAAQIGNLETLTTLRDSTQGITVNWKSLNKDNYNPLQLSVRAGQLETVQILLSCIDKTIIDEAEGDTMTLLQLAAREGHLSVVKLLVSEGANIMIDSSSRHTPLQYAVEEGHLGVAVELLHEISNQLKNEELLQKIYDDAIILATSNGQTEIVAYLLTKRTAQQSKLEEGLMMSAFSGGHIDIIKVLHAAGVSISDRGYYLEAVSHNYFDIAKYFVENVSQDLREDLISFLVLMKKPLFIHETLKHPKAIAFFQEGYQTAVRCAVEVGNTEVAREILRQGELVSKAFNGQRPYRILFAAVLQQKAEIVELFLENGWDPNSCDVYGNTALHIACKHGQKRSVQYLLKHGANPDKTNNDGRTPLHVAAYEYNGDPGVIKFLLGATSNADIQDKDHMTVLHIATKKVYAAKDIVKLLLCLDDESANTPKPRQSADARIRAKGGWTALHFAHKSPDITSMLLCQSLDVNAELVGSNSTPLLLAVEAGCSEVVKLLLDAGADYNARNSYSYSALHLAANIGSLSIIEGLVRAGAVIDIAQDKKLTPLGVALARDYFDIADYLLDKGADPNKCSLPLQIAVSGGSESTVRRLLEKGVDVNAQGGSFGSALHAAMFAANEGLVSILLRNNASSDMMARPFGTPLHAIFYNYRGGINKASRVTELLKNRKINIDCLDYYERTPLILALQHPRASIAYLLEMGANPNARDNTGATALHYAALLRTSEDVEEMLEKQADPTLADGCQRDALYWAAMSIKGPEDNLTRKFEALLSKVPEAQQKWCLEAVLHPAVARGREDILNYIIKKGLNLNALDRNHWSALDIAISYGYSDIKASLDSQGARKGPIDHERPSALSTYDRNCMISLANDNMEATMKGSATDFNDIFTGSIRANHCISPPNGSFFYFEVEIKQGSEKPIVGVGMSEEHVCLNRFVGWDNGSWGYHSDDGNAYVANEGKDYGPRYGTGNVIGCGIDFKSQTIFFTKDGEEKGSAFHDVRGQLYPTVSFQRQATDTSVSVNFGGSPFKYQRRGNESDDQVMHG